jgi:hypothetical protein
MHPEMTLDYEQAKTVFDIAAIAISSMAADGAARSTPKP